jgi:hypothetical protein
MQRIRKAPRAGHTRFRPLALALSSLLLIAAGPALARQCPRGQILRVSKNICVAKGRAVGRHVFYGPTFYGPTKPSREPEEPAADLEPASIPAKKPKPPAPGLSPSPSPYGELSLESFAKP